MTPFLIYATILLIAFSAAVTRYSGRRLHGARALLAADEEKLRGTELAIAETRRSIEAVDRRAKALDDDIAAAREALTAAEKRLAEVRQAPVERHYVFDRLEPRPGVIWTARIRRIPDAITPARVVAAWGMVRDVLVVGGSYSEASERVAQRYSKQSGFEIVRLSPSPLFTARKPAEDAPADPPKAEPKGRGRERG